MDRDRDVIIIYIVILVFWFVSIFLSNKIEEHVKLHEELGYESIGVIQTTDCYGKPKFYRAVKYSDGCEATIIISAEEYFKDGGISNDSK